MNREAGPPPRPGKHLNTALLLYDKPLYRDWAFWTTVGMACMTAFAIGTSNEPTSLPRWLDILLAVITFTVLFGVVPAWFRLRIRRYRAHRRRPAQRPPTHKHGAPTSDWQPQQQTAQHAPPQVRVTPPKPSPTASASADTAPPQTVGDASASGENLSQSAVPLAWRRLDADGFERLLFDLLRSFPEHQNVQWLSHTRAADRGRDLSMERVLRDSTGGTRTERVIVRAKHWLKKPVNLPAVSETVAAVKLWEPPAIRILITATSGRFSADAVKWAEQHNNSGAAPYVELWPESQLEALLASKPHLAAAHGLR
ncbi:restriction endonuclease [Streptomyces sp. NBC_01381]|uniref:restriction endonuclease n=1 Tax=Streptomyces sp. NBC_01381 TaxID=2903845 RepID=UPI0022544D6B|nr:restriction endonuclease [Streptomyces sp. NBC_01381]MCX4665961.1 restriction endonuclease [Streptomyces sp. NBC_01381]